MAADETLKKNPAHSLFVFVLYLFTPMLTCTQLMGPIATRGNRLLNIGLKK